MSILSDTVRGVGRLLFPVRCPVCGGKMPPGSRVVCTRCRYAVPLTGFCYATYNPLWERLSALVPVEQASAFLYFIPGSGWRELIHRFKYDGAWRLARDMGVWYGHCLADSGLYDTVDRIVPVPLHWRKRLRRGYNQAEYLAEGIARALRAEVDRHSVRRIRLRGRFMHAGVFLLKGLHVFMVVVVHPDFLRGHRSGFQHAAQEGAAHFSQSNDTCFHG